MLWIISRARKRKCGGSHKENTWLGHECIILAFRITYREIKKKCQELPAQVRNLLLLFRFVNKLVCKSHHVKRDDAIFRKIRDKIVGLPRDFQLFLTATFVLGFSQSLVDSTFNNFLNETFAIGNLQRGLMELPRELPGFLVIFFSAILFFLCSRRLAFVANFLCAVGILLIGFYSPSFSIMLIWLFIFSIGQHLFFADKPEYCHGARG